MGLPVYLYHAEKGAGLFDSEALPGARDGWYESPTRAYHARRAAKRVTRALKAKGPGNK